jgi:hypothetical protein
MRFAPAIVRQARRGARLAGRLLPWAVLLALLVLRAWDPPPVTLPTGWLRPVLASSPSTSSSPNPTGCRRRRCWKRCRTSRRSFATP